MITCSFPLMVLHTHQLLKECPPMWNPQYWQPNPYDFPSGSNIQFSSSHLTIPSLSQQQNEVGGFANRGPWNHFVGMMNPSYPCPPPPLAAGQMQPPSHFVTLPNNSSNPMDPIFLESEAEHSAQEVNSPSKEGGTPGKGKKMKEQNFTPEEDLLLCTTWLEISCDPVISTGQRKEGLWARIDKQYNEMRGEYPKRVIRALTSRWDKIKADCGKYASLYARVLRENQSGLTDYDKTSMATTLFTTENKRGFPFMHCWTKLKNEPKWQAIVQGTSLRGAAGMSPVGSATPTASVNDLDSDSLGLTGKRPLGRDSTKASRKKAMSTSSQSMKYLTRIHDLQMARLKQSEDKVEKKEAHYEVFKDLEYKKLQVQQEQIEVEKTKLKFQERKEKNDELKEAMAVDLEDIAEDLRPAFIAKRKALVDWFVNNPN